MNGICKDKYKQRSVDEAAAEEQSIRQTEHYTRDGERHYREQMQQPRAAPRSARGKAGADKCDRRSEQRGEKRYDDRIDKVSRRTLTKGVCNILHRKGKVVRIALCKGYRHKRYDRIYNAYRKQQKQDKGNDIAGAVVTQIKRPCNTAAALVALAEHVDKECGDCGNEQYQSEKAALSEILTSYDLLIHKHGEGLIHTADHERYTVVGHYHGKYGKDYAYHRLSHIRHGDSGEAAGL